MSSCPIISPVPSIETSVMQPKSPSGAPAAYAASATTRSASAVHFFARGCGLITMPHRAFAEIIALYIAVEVGFVLGMSAATTPIGVATFQMVPSSDFSMTPAVRIPCIRSWSVRVAKRFFSRLLSGLPKPVSSWASCPSRVASAAPASHIAATMRSTCSWLAVANCFWAACAFFRRSRACWIERRSASIVEIVWVRNADSQDSPRPGGMSNAPACPASSAALVPCRLNTGRAPRPPQTGSSPTPPQALAQTAPMLVTAFVRLDFYQPPFQLLDDPFISPKRRRRVTSRGVRVFRPASHHGTNSKTRHLRINVRHGLTPFLRRCRLRCTKLHPTYRPAFSARKHSRFY